MSDIGTSGSSGSSGTSGVSGFSGTDQSGVAFQGIRFYDGAAFGYLRLFADKVQLVLNPDQSDAAVSYALDGTVPHTFRITGKGKDVKLYVDGKLAIDGSGQFIAQTQEKLVEFGDISGNNVNTGSRWESFKYSVDGSHGPSDDAGRELEEVMSLPGGSIGTLKTYRDGLYISHDPYDASASSKVYRFAEGQNSDRRNTLAITRSNIRSILLDPNRKTNLFDSSGKFLGTDQGLQYMIGGKPSPWDSITLMDELPEGNGWTAQTNCEGFAHGVYNGTLAIDTTQESGQKYMDYVQDKQGDAWVIGADNSKGWTVEARVKILDDGTAGPLADADLDTMASSTTKDVVIVLEESSLMSDPDREIAKRTVNYFLQSLNRWDRFGLVLYRADNGTRQLDSNLLDATEDNISNALKFVDGMLLPEQTNWLPDMLTGTTQALGYDFTSTRRFVIVVGTGFSYYGPRDVTVPGSHITGTPPINPMITGHSVTNDTNNINTAGPNAKIYTVAVGGMLDNPEPKLTFTFGGVTYVWDHDTATTYQNMMSILASDGSGQATRIQSLSDVDQQAGAIWSSISPGFILPTDSQPVSGKLDPRSANIIGAPRGCLPGMSVPQNDTGEIPPDDGLNAPGILINDGTYQEVVSFFQNGVRLKYARLFAKQDLSNQFYNIRVIGKGKAIAVFSKGDNEKDWRRLLYAPEGLYVRGQLSSGKQELPVSATDQLGCVHAVWQDDRSGEWHIYHAKTAPSNILGQGGGLYSPKNFPNWNMLPARVGLGAAPASSSIDAVKNATNVVISAKASFKSWGLKKNDTIIIVDKSALPNIFRRFVVDNVPDEMILELRTYEDLSSMFNGAEFMVAGVGDQVLPSNRVDTQSMDSYAPAILLHSTGDIYVAYMNSEAGAEDIYLRKGNNNPTSVTWVDSLRVTQSLYGALRPALAELPDGNILVVWEEKLESGSSIKSIIVSTTNDKMALVGKTRLLSGEAKTAHSPKAATVYKSPLVVFEETDSNDLAQIYLTEMTEKGDGVVSTSLLSTGIGGNSRNPSIACSRSIELGKILHRACVAWENDETGVSEIMTSDYLFVEYLPPPPPPPPPDDQDGGGGGGSTQTRVWKNCDITPPPIKLYLTNTPATLCQEFASEQVGDYTVYALSDTPVIATMNWASGGTNVPKKPRLYWAYNVTGPGRFYVPKERNVNLNATFTRPSSSWLQMDFLMLTWGWLPLLGMKGAGNQIYDFSGFHFSRFSDYPNIGFGTLRGESNFPCFCIDLAAGESTTLCVMRLECLDENVPVTGSINLAGSYLSLGYNISEL